MRSIFDSLELREKRTSSSSKVRQSLLGSHYFAEKFDRDPVFLEGHTGCVNSIIFTECGSQIITASDDLNINFYDLDGEMVNHMNTIHTNNIFFAQDLPSSSSNEIVSCGADGRVVLSNVVKSKQRQLFKHKGRAHLMALVPLCPTQFYSCGEDGVCCLYDLRTSIKNSGVLGDVDGAGDDEDYSSCVALKTQFTGDNYRSCSANCISVNNNRPYEVAVGGTSPIVSVYDTRKFQNAMVHLCPIHLRETQNTVTGLKYDYLGENIIASYNDDDIYRMDTVEHARPHRMEYSLSDPSTPFVPDLYNRCTPLTSAAKADLRSKELAAIFKGNGEHQGFSVQYEGHRNSDTIKQVNFLGSQSEMVISGSDCGNIFIWDTKCGKLINIIMADLVGAVNCLSGHPFLPYMVSSGLETSGKMWMPSGEHRPLAEEDSDQCKEADEILLKNSHRRSRGEPARENMMPPADFMSWMSAQFGDVSGGTLNQAGMMLLMSRMVAEQGHPEFVDDDEDDEDDEDDDDEVDEDDYDDEDDEDDEVDDEDDEDNEEDDDMSDDMFEPGMHPGTIREDELYAADLIRRYAGIDQDEDEENDQDDDGDGERENVTSAGNVDIAAQVDRSSDLIPEIGVVTEEESL